MNIVKRPVVSEKMTDLAEKLNRHAFVVDLKANKVQIKNEIEKLYDVKVHSVKTMICIGKKRVRGTKSGMIRGKTSKYKKAIIKLIEGETIDIYSNI